MSNFPSRRLLSGRRLALLAGVAGLGAVVAFSGQDLGLNDFGMSHFGFSPNLNSFTASAYAQTSQRPAGFADIVEKVKPSVMSVRVKMGAQAQSSGLTNEEDPFGQNSPFQDFFRRFGRPDGNNTPGPRSSRPASATGCWRSAIRSASEAPSLPASCRRAAATSAPAPMTTSSRSTHR
jgi:serine protease Do